MLNFHQLHLHLDKHIINTEIINTSIFLKTKKSKRTEIPKEIKAIAASFELIVNVRYALMPVAKVTASNNDPRKHKFSIFQMF